MRHLAVYRELCRTACLALFASVQSSQAGTVSGTFQGIADIEVQQFVPGQQIAGMDRSVYHLWWLHAAVNLTDRSTALVRERFRCSGDADQERADS
jgi:hypothetical protein